MAYSRKEAEKVHVRKLRYRLSIFERQGDHDNIRKVKQRIEREVKEYGVK